MTDIIQNPGVCGGGSQQKPPISDEQFGSDLKKDTEALHK